MNKTELEHIKHRVDSIVKCTNGEIATRMERLKKGTGLTDAKKFKFIQSGEATPLPESDLVHIKTSYDRHQLYKVLLMCFEYPDTVIQADKRAFNARIDDKIEELMQEVTLEGKRIIDRIVLGLIEPCDIPDELHKLGSMTALVRTVKSSDFKKAEK